MSWTWAGLLNRVVTCRAEAIRGRQARRGCEGEEMCPVGQVGTSVGCDRQLVGASRARLATGRHRRVEPGPVGCVEKQSFGCLDMPRPGRVAFPVQLDLQS